MNTHTPSPWHVSEYGGVFTVYAIQNNRSVAICTVHGLTEESARANAELIALAPQMAEVAKLLEAKP